MCDRVVWVDDWRIRASGGVTEMLVQYREASHHLEDDGSRFHFDSAALAPPTEGWRDGRRIG
jgi:hypothetical protein